MEDDNDDPVVIWWYLRPIETVGEEKTTTIRKI
jgi:hypothetical protein